MIMQVNFSRFCDEFQRAGRADQFSYEAKKALFEYLDEDDAELDVIALCCEYTESTVDEVISDYGLDDADLDYELDDVFGWLCDRTFAIDLGNGSFLFQRF
jgi:hypothetical protein